MLIDHCWIIIINIVRLQLLFSKEGLGGSLLATRKGVIFSTAVTNFFPIIGEKKAEKNCHYFSILSQGEVVVPIIMITLHFLFFSFLLFIHANPFS